MVQPESDSKVFSGQSNGIVTVWNLEARASSRSGELIVFDWSNTLTT
jgi:hypothetical protein